ncbi:MAG: protein kinase [Planctomycetota bacterium]
MDEGRQVAGFRLERHLGAGAMGQVYAAREEATGRMVALKFLHGGVLAEPVAAERFRREGIALARVDHPHVVKVHASGSAQGRPYLVMELLPGRTLAGALEQGLPRAAALDLLLQVAAGVGALHAAGLVHRDLKPENVLLDAEGRAKVGDLGLAYLGAAESLTDTGRTLGSPGYMAPEALVGRRVRGPASDVYALGVMLYEVLTGELPHPAPNLLELAAMRLADPAPDPRRASPDAPPALARLCRVAMAAEPAQRPPDGLAFHAALSAALAAPPRPRWPLALAGACGVLALAALTWGQAGSGGEAADAPNASSSPVAPGAASPSIASPPGASPLAGAPPRWELSLPVSGARLRVDLAQCAALIAPDRLLVGDELGRLRLLDPAGRELLCATVEEGAPIVAVGEGPAGYYALLGGGRLCRVDPHDGRVRAERALGPSALGFLCADERVVVRCGEMLLQLDGWDLSTAHQRDTAGACLRLARAPSGQLIAAIGRLGDVRQVRIARLGRQLEWETSAPFTGRASALAGTRERWWIGTSDGRLVELELGDALAAPRRRDFIGEELLSLDLGRASARAHSGTVLAIAPFPEQGCLLSLAKINGPGEGTYRYLCGFELTCWDLAAGKQRWRVRETERCRPCAFFSPSGEGALLLGLTSGPGSEGYRLGLRALRAPAAQASR